MTGLPRTNESGPIEEGARYAGFWTKVDCQECGNEIEIEGDVSNGDVVDCDSCHQKLEVYGR